MISNTLTDIPKLIRTDSSSPHTATASSLLSVYYEDYEDHVWALFWVMEYLW